MAKQTDQYVICGSGVPLASYNTLAAAKADPFCKDLLWTEENPIKTVGRKLGVSTETIVIWQTPHRNK